MRARKWVRVSTGMAVVLLSTAGGVQLPASRASTATSSTTTGAVEMIATVVADRAVGQSPYGYSGDGGPATEATLNQPEDVLVHGGGLLIADTFNHRIRRVDAFGIITTIAGRGGNGGYSGDGGPATAAELYYPSGIAADDTGNVYLVDGFSVVRRIDTSGTITTVAGRGTEETTGDGGPATEAGLQAHDIDFDGHGNLLITGDRRVRRVVPGHDGVIDGDADEIITTVVGNGDDGGGGDGGPATAARLSAPKGLRLDRLGNLYIADSGSDRIRKVAPGPDGVIAGGADEIITTVAGDGTDGYGGDGGPATAARLSYPDDVEVDSDGSLYIADPGNNRIRKVTPGADGMAAGNNDDVITTVAGTPTPLGFDAGDGGAATKAALFGVSGVSVDAAGALFAVERNGSRVRRIAKDVLFLATTARPDPATIGEQVTYSHMVTTASQATGVTLVDSLPAGTTFASAAVINGAGDGSCAHSAGTVTCSLGQITEADPATVTIRVFAPSQPGEVTNTASVAANEFDPYPITDVTRTATPVEAPQGAGIVVALLDAPDPANVTKPLTYSVAVANGLAATASGVTLIDRLPAEVAFASAVASRGGCSEAGGTVTCRLGDLPPGGTATARITVIPAATGVVINSVTLLTDEVVPVATAVAETTVSDARCGEVVTADTTLDGDIGPCAADGLVIGANGITVDLGGHRVFGFPGPSEPSHNGGIVGNQAGIRLLRRSNVTVRDGTVAGFDGGVVLEEARSNSITRIEARDNIGPDRDSPTLGDGIALFDSSFNRIVANSVIHNGNFDGIAVLGGGSDGNHLEGNLVEDTVAAGVSGFSRLQPLLYSQPPTDGQGIILNASSIGFPNGQIIEGSTVVLNVIRRNGGAGIANVNNVDGLIAGNTIEANGTVNLGNGIGVQLGPGVYDRPTNLLVQSNDIHDNPNNGIHLIGKAAGNRVLNNNVTNSGASDLRDDHGDCSYNVWSGNRATTAKPVCTAAPDTEPPETILVSGPSGTISDTTPSFEFSSPEWASSFTCRIDGEDFAPCSSPHTVRVLPDGAHSFEVRATDPAGNTDPTPEGRSFSVDATPPETTITAGPSAATDDDTPTFEFASDDEAATFACRLDGEPFSACASPHTTESLTLGSHTFEVRASDPVGNTDLTPAAVTFRIEKPTVRITDAAMFEGDKGTTLFAFIVSLSFGASREVTVTYATADGEAVSPSDYTAVTGTLHFSPDETLKAVVVAVKGDRREEPDETFVVDLYEATNAEFADDQGVGTIRNDDTRR